MNIELKKTALYDQHQKHHAKMVDFSGWTMPISYEGVIKEHHHVRSKVGLFDVSHMGELMVSGDDALAYLQFLTVNNVEKLNIGQGQYTAICNETGGLLDDLILYRVGQQKYLICVNASNIEKDFLWFQKHQKAYRDLKVENVSNSWSQIAIQGEHSQTVVREVFNEKFSKNIQDLRYTHILQLTYLDEQVYLARTGYTGEKGYEVYLPHQVASQFWEACIATNPKTEIMPIGLGARDTLRLEACYLLYGNDMDETVSPFEAGIAWATKMDKGEFLGYSALKQQKELGVDRKIYAFQMLDRAIPRSKMKVLDAESNIIGMVTSGSTLPTLEASGGLALLDKTDLKVGEIVYIDVRGKVKQAKLVKRPFYEAKTKN